MYVMLNLNIVSKVEEYRASLLISSLHFGNFSPFTPLPWTISFLSTPGQKHDGCVPARNEWIENRINRYEINFAILSPLFGVL